MIRFLIFLQICFCFVACKQKKSQTRFVKKLTSRNAIINIDTNKIAVFDVRNESWLIKRSKADKSFNLSSYDIQVTDSIFKNCLYRNRLMQGYYFRRQYVPFIDKEGNKKVWINGFCKDDDSDISAWKKYVVTVMDGGDCYFNVIINITGKSFSDLIVNGIG